MVQSLEMICDHKCKVRRALHDGVMQCGGAQVVLGVDVRAVLEQHTRARLVTLCGREVECREAVVGARVHRAARVAREQLHELRVALTRSHLQRHQTLFVECPARVKIYGSAFGAVQYLKFE